MRHVSEGDEGAVNIGVLDDNQAILDFIKTALELSGHHVQTYTSSAPFLATLLPGYPQAVSPPFAFDLVIIDLVLQADISGAEVIQRIREKISPEQLPIIVISALGMARLTQVKQQFPDVILLSKPFSIKTLLDIIQHLRKI